MNSRERSVVGHYIMLIKLTDSGEEKADLLPDIMKSIVDVWNTVGSGASVHATEGPYDLVAEGDVPNDIDMTWLGAQLATNGISTCTMRAFGEAEVRTAFESRPVERKYPVRLYEPEQ
jgi:uncharacterized protein with GYD domain